VTPRPISDEIKPPLKSKSPVAATLPPISEDVEPPRPHEPRQSTRIRKPVDRFTPDKAHGYNQVRKFANNLIKCICFYHSVRRVSDMHYTTALAMDPEFGILDGFSALSPDILSRHPYMFRAKSTSDPDTPTIKEALRGPHREEFIEGMALEIEELSGHDTWTVMKRTDIKPSIREDGSTFIPQVIPLTWAFRIKRWPDGLL
jgi:hypothetical protein